MYTETKLENYSVVTRGPLAVEMFGVPAGKFITYARRRNNGGYGLPEEKYGVHKSNTEREAMEVHTDVCADVLENYDTKIVCKANKNLDEKDKIRKPEDLLNDVVCDALTKALLETIDPTGQVWRIIEAYKAEGVPVKTSINALARLIDNHNN